MANRALFQLNTKILEEGCNFGQETISLTFGYEHTPENLPVVVYSIIVAIDVAGHGRFAPLPKLGQAKTNTRLATTH